LLAIPDDEAVLVLLAFEDVVGNVTNEPAKEQQQRQGPAVAGGTASPNKVSVGLGCQKARESVLLFHANKPTRYM